MLASRVRLPRQNAEDPGRTQAPVLPDSNGYYIYICNPYIDRDMEIDTQKPAIWALASLCFATATIGGRVVDDMRN